MKHKTLVRIALRLMGVWFIASSLLGVVSGVLQAVFYLGLGRSSFNWYSLLIPPMVGLVNLGIGLYLFSGGKWILDKIIPSNRPYCHECGYELTGNTCGQCPECGNPVPPRAGDGWKPDGQLGAFLRGDGRKDG